MAAEDTTARPPSAAQELHAPQLSAWLRLMLAEIAAKRERLEQARAEQTLRAREADAPDPRPGR